MYGNDDWALLVSTIIAVGQYIAELIGLSQGLGKSSTLLDQGQVESIQRVCAPAVARVWFYGDLPFVAVCCCAVLPFHPGSLWLKSVDGHSHSTPLRKRPSTKYVPLLVPGRGLCSLWTGLDTGTCHRLREPCVPYKAWPR